MDGQFRLYAGDGSTLADKRASLPSLAAAPWSDDPRGYVAEDGLRDAVNVALALGQPLLVTGEPGTGRRSLRSASPTPLSLPEPLVFRVKSTSTARELFYKYD